MSRRFVGIAHGEVPSSPERRVLRARPVSRLPRVAWTEGTQVAALGALLVLAPGVVDGAYAPRTWTALTVLFAAIGGLGLLDETRRRPVPLARLEVAALLALAGWASLSSVWAVVGASPSIEARRCVLYAAALLAAVVHTRTATRMALVAGVAAGIAGLVAVGLVERALHHDASGTYYGSLLREPIGYPNGLGILVGVGLLLTTGLVPGATTKRLGAALIAIGAVLALALLLTGSRGAVLAVVAGAIVWLAGPRFGERLAPLIVAAAAGALAWLVVPQADRGGTAVIAAAAAAALLGAAGARALPVLERRPRAVLASAALVAVGALVVAGLPSTTSSYRVEYWDSALETIASNPLAGAGAGSFAVTWLAQRDVETDVRDAHSLYLESLAELGPIGLALVVGVMVIPIAAWWRSTRDDLGRLALAGWIAVALHAGIDWDWELPVVVLGALGLAGALLASPGRDAIGVRKEES